VIAAWILLPIGVVKEFLSMIRAGVIVDNQKEEGDARALSPAIMECGRQPVPSHLILLILILNMYTLVDFIAWDKLPYR
jgi:hypothetical protein